MDSSKQLLMTIYAALMAALMAVGAFLAVPIGPVPIVLQNLFVFLAGLLLGSRWGLASVSVYILAGGLGLPIFAGGMGGVGRLVGPTGGYLIGYIPAVYLIGLISEKGSRKALLDVLAMVIGAFVVYACGVTWLKILSGMTLGKTLAVGMVPFLIGDAIKIVAAVPIAKAVRPIIKKYG